MRRIQILTFCFLITSITITGCFLNKKVEKPVIEKVENNEEIKTTELKMKISKIIYHFGDSSVPPRYHRSYTITATENELHVIVDSYGEIKAEKKVEISASQFDEISETLSNIESKKLGENKGCTGGTSERITYFSSDQEEFSASVYHCGGKDSGTLAGDINAVKSSMKKLIPDFGSLLLN